MTPRAKYSTLLLGVLLVGIIVASVALPMALAQERKNYFAAAWPYLVPPQGHFNTFVTNAITLGIYWDLMEMPLGMYIWHNSSWIKLLATDWKFDKSTMTFTVHLRKGVVWNDGTPFTSKDVKCTWLILYMMGHALFNYVDPKRIETPDDYTVVFHITSPVSPIILERYIIRTNVRAYKTYGKWCDQVEALLKQGKDRKSEEMQKLLQEFNKFRPKEMLVTGPYMIDVPSITDSELWLKKNPKSYFAKYAKFDWIRVYNGETPVITPLVLAKKVDYATHGFPVATEKQFRKIGIKILRPPTYFGPAIYFNYKHPEYGELFSKKEFRKAIAYAINKTEAGFVSLGLSGKPIKYMTGVPELITLNWMKPEDLKKLEDYSYNPKKAEELLKSIGLEKKGGVWYWKGKPLELELSYPAEYADWAATAQNVASQLTKFGIKITLRAVTFTQHPIEVQQGKFMLAIRHWGSGHPHPFMSYDSVFNMYNQKEYLGTGLVGMGLSMIWDTKYGKVNATKLLIDMGKSFDIEKQKEAFAKMALAFNDFLPIIPLWERLGNNPVLDGVRACGWLPFDDPLYKNSVYSDNFVVIMILKGILYPCGVKPTPAKTTPKVTVAAPGKTVTVTKTIEKTVTVTAAGAPGATVTTTVVRTETNWGIAAGIGIVLLIVGIAIGYAIKRR